MYLFRDLCKATGPKNFEESATNFMVQRVNEQDDERYYEQVIEEIRTQGVREGLWAKAVSLTNGDEHAARARYIGLRVEQLVSADRNAALEGKKKARGRVRARITRKVVSVLHLLAGIACSLIAFSFILAVAEALHDIGIKPRWHTASDFQRDKPAQEATWDSIYVQLDREMPQDQYEAIQRLYFNDRIRPKVRPEYSVDATYEAFVKDTRRPEHAIHASDNLAVMSACTLGVAFFGIFAYGFIKTHRRINREIRSTTAEANPVGR